MEGVKDLLLFFGFGLTDKTEIVGAELGDGSVNFYPDDEGYLVSYAGRTDWFQDAPLGGDASLGTRPTIDVDITRIFTFRDFRGKEHIVFVRGAELCEVYGNSYTVLYTFAGDKYDGHYFPHLYVHEAKLIIVNFGDPVLMWDGMKNVHPLGVQESPLPPEVRVSVAPYAEPPGVSRGPWADPTFWWPMDRPNCGPTESIGADGVTRVFGYYDCVIQFIDEYGNKGRISPPSPTFVIKPWYYVSVPEGKDWHSCEYPVLDYYPPMVEDHIIGVLLGRTLNLNTDGGRGTLGVYYRESTRLNTTYNRATLCTYDSVLAENGLIDTEVRGPPQASFGCSWSRRTFLAGGEDQNIVDYSDQDYFGQYRPLNRFRAHDHVRAVVPMGDRIAIISRSSTEVLYETDAGLGILQQDFDNGSIYGRSFVDVGNGAIFGLWNKGFGFFDGKSHTYVETPYYIRALYVDDRFYASSAIKDNDWYILTLRKNSRTAKNNYLLKFNFRLNRWYLIEESVYDLCVWRGAFLGCDNSIYELFKGVYPAQAKVYIRGLIPKDSRPDQQRTLIESRILMEPSSKESFSLTVEGEFTSEPATTVEAKGLPSRQGASRFDKLVPAWNDANLTYASLPEWISPRDVWLTPTVNLPLAAYSHTLKLVFPTGHLVKLKALALSFSGNDRASTT